MCGSSIHTPLPYSTTHRTSTSSITVVRTQIQNERTFVRSSTVLRRDVQSTMLGLGVRRLQPFESIFFKTMPIS